MINHAYKVLHFSFASTFENLFFLCVVIMEVFTVRERHMVGRGVILKSLEDFTDSVILTDPQMLISYTFIFGNT